MAAVIRLKRKASEEPAEAILIALKKSKIGTDITSNEVYFKLAATVSSETDSVHNHIQAAIAKDKQQRAEWGKNPKAVRHRLPYQQRMRALHLAESRNKRHDLHNYIRLILTQSSPMKDDDKSKTEDAAEEELKEMKSLYKLYDIIEETEDVKSKPTESPLQAESEITCNGVPLVRTVRQPEKKSDLDAYVYDVYVADEDLDERFTDGTVCVKQCDLSDLVFGEQGDGEPEEQYDDEDDSNDEDNWRNDYPDDDPDIECDEGEGSLFEKDYDYSKDYDYGEFNDSDDFKLLDQFKEFGIDEERDGFAYAEYKARTLKAFLDEEEYSD